jgi:hypothetical protein
MARRRKRKEVRSDETFDARGWIEPVFGKMKEGMFGAERHDVGPMSWFTFYPAGAHWTEAQHFPWSDVESVKMLSRADLPEKVTDAHKDLLGRKGLTDPSVIVGWLTGTTGVPRSDLFVLVPITDLGTGDQWMALFEKAGAEVDNTN